MVKESNVIGDKAVQFAFIQHVDYEFEIDFFIFLPWQRRGGIVPFFKILFHDENSKTEIKKTTCWIKANRTTFV